MSSEKPKRASVTSPGNTFGIGCLPRNWLVPVILLSLREWNSYGYERLRENLRDAFPGIEYDTDFERMAEQFVVELGWVQERTFPLDLGQSPRATLSAQDLLELADSFYRFRMERWTQGEAGRESRVRAFSAMTSNSPLPN